MRQYFYIGHRFNFCPLVIRLVRKITVSALLLAVSLLAASPAALAAGTVTVCDSGCDETTIAGALSSVDADGTILVSAGVYTEHDLTVDKNVSITGDGAATTIVQAAEAEHLEQGRVFNVDSGVTAAIEDLTIRYGDVTGTQSAQFQGGGIRNSGDLTLTRVTVASNRTKASMDFLAEGGGIYSEGPLTLNNTTIENNMVVSGDSYDAPLDSKGGGVYVKNDIAVINSVIRNNTVIGGDCNSDSSCADMYNYGGGVCIYGGTLTLIGSAIQDNTTGQAADSSNQGSGGGIYGNEAEVDITQSTISGNAAFHDEGGGIYLMAHGVTLDLKIKNTTLSGNSAAEGGAIYMSTQVSATTSLLFDNCTIYGNEADDYGGAFFFHEYDSDATVEYKNTIFFGNTSGGAAEDCYNNGATLTSRGNNLFENGTSIPTDGNGDRTVTDAGLSSLGDHGGPTMTHALQYESPALEGASATDIEGNNVAVDQRVVSRPQETNNNIGAFEARIHTLTIATDGIGAGRVVADIGNIDCGLTCEDQYPEYEKITLTAIPESTYPFSAWSGGGCSGLGTCTVTLDEAKTVTATFSPYTLSVTKTGTGTGTVTADLGNIACGSACSDDYDLNTQVTLTAIPSTDSSFSGWSGGDCSGAWSCQVTIDQAKTVTAEFSLNRYTLYVNKTGTGVGTVSADSGSIACGSACSDDYDHSTLVTLSAAAGAGSGFSGWSGVCSGTGTCGVTMDQTKTVTAGFTLNRYALSVGKTGTGQGTVTSDLGSIACGSACSNNYNYNTTVSLLATPAVGSSFSGWSGGFCSGTGNCQVTVDQALTVTAAFTLNQYTLSVGKTGTGEGTVASDSGNIACGSACSDDYNYNTQVTLSAGPSTGSSFLPAGPEAAVPVQGPAR